MFEKVYHAVNNTTLPTTPSLDKVISPRPVEWFSCQEDMHLHTHSVTYVSHKYFAGVGSALLSSKSHTRPTLEC